MPRRWCGRSHRSGDGAHRAADQRADRRSLAAGDRTTDRRSGSNSDQATRKWTATLPSRGTRHRAADPRASPPPANAVNHWEM